MATVMTEQRLAAGIALNSRLRAIRSGQRGAEPREVLNRPIVLALADEAMTGVIRRLGRYHSPSVLAVYFPDRDELVLAEITTVPTTEDTISVRRELTVGMVIDAQRSAETMHAEGSKVGIQVDPVIKG
jgi:hypothetical protein